MYTNECNAKYVCLHCGSIANLMVCCLCLIEHIFSACYCVAILSVSRCADERMFIQDSKCIIIYIYIYIYIYIFIIQYIYAYK